MQTRRYGGFASTRLALSKRLRSTRVFSGSIAAVVRRLIDTERARPHDPSRDPAIRYLLEETPPSGAVETSVETLDDDLYGR